MSLAIQPAGARAAPVAAPGLIGSWTDEALADMRRLLAEGLSAARVAAELNSRFGLALTRNAVLGKCWRLGIVRTVKKAPKRKWEARPPLIVRRAQLRLAPAQVKALPPPAPPEPVAIQPSLRVKLLDLREGMCRWPDGDPITDADFGFCGAAVARNADTARSFCVHHCRIAYVPVGERAKALRASIPFWAR